MSGPVRYLAGYLVDSFRERVAVSDLQAEGVRRVRVVGAVDDDLRALVARMFPSAEIVSGSADAVVIPMAGGPLGPRLRALLSRARHKLLVPSPHYVYRFGMRRGVPALLWAVIDRLLLAPLALLWLGMTAGWTYLTGLAGAARERPDGPQRVLLIRLLPARAMARLLRRLRTIWPSARLIVLSASSEGEQEIAEAADEVLLITGLRAREVIARMRQAAPDVTIIAGGADYGLGPTYLKAALLARLSRARRHWQWDPGDEPDHPRGGVVTGALARALRRWRWDPRAAPDRSAYSGGRATAVLDTLARPLRRRYYRRPPRCGPREVQIAITAACNYHCLMCAFHNPAVDERHKEANLPRMSYGMFARLVTDLKRQRVSIIGLTGYGEPFTHPQAMDMIACALELGLDVVPTTNGSLLTDERAKQLVDLGLPRLHVSINAGTDETYAKMHWGTPPGRLAEILGRLRRMAEYAKEVGRRPVHVQVSAVIARMNMGEIPAMVRAAHEARAKELMLITMSAVDGQPDLPPRPDDWPAIRQAIREAREVGKRLGVRVLPEGMEETAAKATIRSIYERVPCYMGYELCHVMADGAIQFCAECLFTLGNLHERDFASIWNSELYQQARRAAMEILVTGKPPGPCGCFRACCHIAGNIDVHRRLYGEGAVRGIG